MKADWTTQPSPSDNHHSPDALDVTAEGRAAGRDSSRLEDAALSKLDGPELTLLDSDELLMSARSPEVTVLPLREGERSRERRRFLLSWVFSITSCSPSSCKTHHVVVMLLIQFTEVVPTVGGGRGGERELTSNRYTVTTRMISALRWAAV